MSGNGNGNGGEKSEWDEWESGNDDAYLGMRNAVWRVFRSLFFRPEHRHDRLCPTSAPWLGYGPVLCRARSVPPFAHHPFSILDASTRVCHVHACVLFYRRLSDTHASTRCVHHQSRIYNCAVVCAMICSSTWLFRVEVKAFVACGRTNLYKQY